MTNPDSHSENECSTFIVRLLPDLPELVNVLSSVAASAEKDVAELLGTALWDIFSDNHTVSDSDGTANHLGSFRGSAGFIADEINRRYPQLDCNFGYLDFYVGSMGFTQRDDLGPLYRWIFQRLRESDCDWEYSFPRVYLLDFGGAWELDDFADYDPSESFRAELEEAERDSEVQAMQEKLDALHADAVNQARGAQLPETVAAYRAVFGMLPRGWPHQDA